MSSPVRAAGRETATRADGEYRFDDFPQGPALLRVNAAEHQEVLLNITFNTPAGITTLDFTLPSWVALGGLVIDVDTGLPITAAAIRPLFNDVPGAPVVTTDATGGYRFDRLLAGDRNFSATAAGYHERRGGTNVNGTSRLNFELRRAASHTFTGVVGGDAGSTAVFPFAMRRTGDLDVRLTWTGPELALMLQLFSPAAGLLNEVRGGPTEISLARPLFASLRHEIRVITLRPETRIRFTVVITPKD